MIDYKKNFIKKANKIHNNKYNYSLVEYVNTDTKVTIICPSHGQFEQTPRSHAHKGNGCNKCAVDRSMSVNTKTTKQFIMDAMKVHGDRYDYSLSEYVNANTPIKIICKIHGEFFQEPYVHTSFGCGCSKCNKRLSQSDFINKANEKHNNRYDYSLVKYNLGSEKIKIICNEHGEFLQQANSHLNGSGCPKCKYGNSYSKISIEWLEGIMDNQTIFIQHAKNNGEYKIPNTNIRVDGYCKETNTVYEFHGDVFHGNPELFESNSFCHPFNKEKTAGQLFKETKTRETRIKKLGYNLVVMWEGQYKNKY